MKRLLTLLFVLSLSVFGAQAQKVFSVEYESRADVKVFVVNYESQADLLVYKEKYESGAEGNEGNWFFVEYESRADVKNFFFECESRAGWKNKEKIHFFF